MVLAMETIMPALLFVQFSPAEYARLKTCLPNSPGLHGALAKFGFFEGKKKNKNTFRSQRARLPADFACLVPCTLKLPCAASCLGTCTSGLQCNVPAACWRLQTAKCAPAYACEPSFLPQYSRDSLHASKIMNFQHEAIYSIALVESVPTCSSTSLTRACAAAKVP